MQDAQTVKKLILAESSEMTVEKFEELIKIEGSFTSAEIQELYKTFRSVLHGGRFVRYAEVIFQQDPSVDPLRIRLDKKGEDHKIEAFFARKTIREEAPAANPDEATERKKPKVATKSKPDNTLTRFLQKK